MSTRYSAKVVRIFDGDTVEVELKKNHKKTIRFFGIDCPERTQEYGPVARDRIKELLKDKEVEVFPVELGKYNREVGIVYIGGISIAEILLKEGLAFASGSNHKLASTYYRFQERARANKTGMWKLGAVENPATFRKRKKNYQFRLPKSTTKPNPNSVNNNNENTIKDVTETPKTEKTLLQQLKELIGDKVKDLTEKFDRDDEKYISGNELLEKMNKKKNKPKV